MHHEIVALVTSEEFRARMKRWLVSGVRHMRTFRWEGSKSKENTLDRRDNSFAVFCAFAESH